MAFNLSWDETGERLYETGVDRGVLFKISGSGVYGAGVAWNGLTTVNENPSGAEETALYADDSKYLSLYSKEEFGCTIEAYTYPEEFEECDGSAEIATGVTAGQQTRKSFGFSYRTKVGNDTAKEDYGYKIHLVYGATASPSDKSYTTINDSPDAVTFSWEVKTVPVPFETHTEFKPTSTLTIDSTKVNEEDLTAFENVLYGSGSTPATLPLPDDVIGYFVHESGESGVSGGN